MTPPSYGHFDFVFLLLARHSMHAFSALAASVGSPKTGEEYMRSQNFLLHTEAKYPTYCPPVLGGRGYGREGIFFYPQVTSLWSVTQRLSIIGRLQRPNNLLNPTPSHPCNILHTPYSLFLTPYSLFPTPYSLLLTHYSLLPAPYSLFLTPCSLLLTPYSLFPTPYSLFLTPCSLLLVPYSLLPIPYSLFPAPYSLFPAPYSLLPTPYLTAKVARIFHILQLFFKKNRLLPPPAIT